MLFWVVIGGLCVVYGGGVVGVEVEWDIEGWGRENYIMVGGVGLYS